MKQTIDHNVEASAMLWLDHVFTAEMEGFTNFTGTFRKVNSDVQGIYAYAAPHRQFVYDSSAIGAIIPSGITVNGSFIPKGTGLNPRVDVQHGQALFFTNNGNATVTAKYAFKEVNVYIIDKPEEEILFDKRYESQPKYGPAYANFDPKDQPFPAILIQSAFGKNETLDFDGLAETTIPVRLTVLADTPDLLKSICGTLRDKQETYMPLFENSQLPFNKFYDLKAPFNYVTTAQAIQGDSNRLAFIQTVTVSPFQSRVNALIGANVFGAFVDIDYIIMRYPHG